MPLASVIYTWKRCQYYEALLGMDGASSLWPLGGEFGDVAHDVFGGAPGSYTQALHASVSDGALQGVSDPAARFDGTNDALIVPDAPDYAGNVPYTFEMWVRPLHIDGTYRYLMSRETTSAGQRQGTGVWLSSAGLGFERISAGAKTGVTYMPGLPVGAWSYVVATYDGQVMRLYVDGTEVGSRVSTASLAQFAGPTVIGAGSKSGYFQGDIDEVAAYPKALARAHFIAHYAAATSTPCTDILGASGSTYTPALADLGDELAVTVKYTDSTGAASTLSASTNGAVSDADGQIVAPIIDNLAAGQTVSGNVVVNVTPLGAPADQIEFDVDGQYRYAKVAEAPYQYTWYTYEESNGPHTLTVKLWGPSASVPTSASVTVTVSNKTVHVTPLPFGKESAYAVFNEGDQATANNILDGTWPARGYALPYLGWPLTWTEDPYGDAYWRFYFYGMQPLSSLLYEWQSTASSVYLSALISILRSYVAYDDTRPLNTNTFDNDHASAYRTMTLINIYFKLKRDGVLPADLDAGLTVSLQKLGTFLAVPSHFEADYNHGFNEGAALLLVADNFPGWPQSAEWRTLAISRLLQMLTNTIDPDGVEVENSPFYHVYVLGLVYQIAQWAAIYEPELAPAYNTAAQKMLTYAADITEPDGYLPMLGATATTYMPAQDPSVYAPMAATDPAFQFAYTRGTAGTPPPDGTVLFPTSGLFIMRSPLTKISNLPNQTYVTFNAGTYRTSHSSLDALGITMYSNGTTLLPTSGLYTYTQQPDLEYFHGTRSHNTVVVDGQDQAEGFAQAGSYGAANGSTWASGTSNLYAGVTHRRRVIILRQGITLVTDDLQSANTHSYAQTWHLAPGSTPSVQPDGSLSVTAAGKTTLSITQANPSDAALQTFYGASDPMQGWYSATYAFKEPDWALQYTRAATNASFSTRPAAGPYASQSSSVTQTPTPTGSHVNVCAGTTGYTVLVPTDMTEAPSITSDGCS